MKYELIFNLMFQFMFQFQSKTLRESLSMPAVIRALLGTTAGESLDQLSVSAIFPFSLKSLIQIQVSV